LPELSLAFEYQGEVHYHSTGVFGSPTTRQNSDAFKQALAKQYGITVIPIPYWWNNSTKDLTATIHSYRPDIQFESLGVPIPLTPPAQRPRKKYITLADVLQTKEQLT
jgi:hypothetical protein